ncbi:MAG: ABC transporter substrate-binding protein [Acidobacteriota bacterium]
MRWRLAIALMAACAAACARSATVSRDLIVVATVNAPTTMDPLVGLDESSQRIHQLLFSSLLTIGDDLRIIPDLAVRFDTTDAQNYTAGIPPGVRFHNGHEMTSADVAYTFRRFLDPKFVSGKKGAFHDLQAVDILDRYTVVFRLKTPSGAFPSSLTNLGIVPEGTGAEAGRAPIGSGPYRLREFVPDDHVTLDAFADYYRGVAANPGIVVKVVPDDTMRGLELRKGDVDLVVNDLAPDLVHSLRAAGRLNVVTSPGTDFAYIGLNLRDPILENPKVRQAIGYAIDRGAIVRYLRRDLARPASGIIPDISWAYSADLFSFTYDPERSKALLDEAGYRDPDGDGPIPRLRLVFKTSTAEQYRLQAAVLQEQLSHVGIALEIRSYEFATLFTDIVKGNFQMYTLVFSAGAASDPDILRRVFHSTQAPPNGFNRAHYASAEADRLLDLATDATTLDERKRYYIAAERVIAADAPMISLYARTNVVIAQPDLDGIRVSPLGDFAFLSRVFRRTSPQARPAH